MKNILLIGGGGHCKSVIDVIEQENKFKISGIIDKKELKGRNILGYEIIGSDEDLHILFNEYKYAFITIGQLKSNLIRVELFNKLKEIGFILPVIKSPLSYVSQHASIDEGTIIMHHAFINADVKIGKNCIINTKALIEHDSVIENNCHISTASVLNGGVTVEENTFFGSNATSKEYIACHGFIKAGSIVK
jgi:sugar O-acyltransferase (sialic acid O-acetyltransferase NeuD family)